MTSHPTTSSEPTSRPSRWNPWRWPLYLRVLFGVLLGFAVGSLFETREIAAGWTTTHLGVIAGIYIQLLTTLATPLIFFAIVEAFVQTEITRRQGLKMLVICTCNIAVAFVIGLTILNVWEPGRSWQGTLASKVEQLGISGGDAKSPKVQELADKAKGVSLSPLEMLKSYVPKSIVQPFAENMLLTVAAAGLLCGAALRSLKQSADAELSV
ncbi:MAG: cation:dicarboxylase symporter family transporter, partial [Planctomycetota bacterium]